MHEGLIKDDVHKLTIEHTPHMNVSVNNTNLIIKMENRYFENCEDLKYELECKATESEEYTSVIIFTQPAISLEEYAGIECRVR